MVENFPMRIDKEYFRDNFGQDFPILLDEDKDEFVSNCIDNVYAMFHGVQSFWEMLPRKVYESKTRLCFGFLTAWYIADMYPKYTAGVASMGGMPIASKSIGGVKVSFNTKSGIGKDDLLLGLKTNKFGVFAYKMLKTSSKARMFISIG